SMKLPSAYLSHTPDQRSYAEALAVRLGRWGILTWLEVGEVPAGPMREKCIQEAAQQEGMAAVILCHEAILSRRADEEPGLVLPIDESRPVDSAAEMLARAIFDHLGIRSSQTLGILLDQRGHGKRLGWPAIPDKAKEQLE